MKVAAGGLQSYATHDDVASRQAQESRRGDYQPKPVHSENTEALNRNALNKTVERPRDAGEAYDVPLRFPPRQKKDGRGGTGLKEGAGGKQNAGNKRRQTGGKTPAGSGPRLDRYI